MFVDVTQSPKIAACVAAGTTGSGILSKINITSDDLANAAMLFGLILSIVLTISHIRRDIRETAEHNKRMAKPDDKS